MTYQVFNPAVGVHVAAKTIDEAKDIRKSYIDEHLQKLQLYQGVSNENPNPDDAAVANEFAAIKHGVAHVGYLYSVYNATTEKIISRVFEYQDDDTRYLVKVSNGAVTEWYQSWGEFGGKKRYFLALDLEKEVAIEYYELESDGVYKYGLDGSLMAKTIASNYEAIPEDKKHLLDTFDKRDKIIAYSNKGYGFCVEFSEITFTPYIECTVQQKIAIDAEKNSYVKRLTNFTVTEEITHENGDVTWVLVDTTTW